MGFLERTACTLDASSCRNLFLSKEISLAVSARGRHPDLDERAMWFGARPRVDDYRFSPAHSPGFAYLAPLARNPIRQQLTSIR
jgi:hypothetical protein